MLDATRSDCMTLFAGMTPEDDAKDTGPDVKLIGRWTTLGEAMGFCICEARDATALGAWLTNWVPMGTITTVPILDDNMAREIILGKSPPYTVDYGAANSGPKEGESLYFIEYTFMEKERAKGFQAFANLTKEADVADAGNNMCLGRWHNLGTGSGVAVCSSKSEVDLYKWAYNWSAICNCVVRPVLNDADFRAMFKSKPGFAEKHAALMESMKGSK